MAGVVGVLNDTFGLSNTSSLMCLLERRKLTTHNALRRSHHSLQCFALSRCAVPEPGGGATRQYALDGAAVECSEDTRAHSELL